MSSGSKVGRPREVAYKNKVSFTEQEVADAALAEARRRGMDFSRWSAAVIAAHLVQLGLIEPRKAPRIAQEKLPLDDGAEDTQAA